MRGLVAVALVATIGCSNSSGGGTESARPPESASVEEIKALLDPKRAEIEAVRAKLAKAVEAAKAHPDLTPIASPPPKDPKAILVSDEEKRTWDYKSLWCTPGDYKRDNLFRQLDAPYQVRRFDFETLAPAIPTVFEAKFALVCRTGRLDPLVIDEASKSFSGGYFEGECRLFELEGTKYLGGFAIHQGMSDRLSYGNYNPSANTFSSDLGTAVSTALNTALWGNPPPKEGLHYGCNFPEK